MIDQLRSYTLFEVILFDNVLTILASMWISQRIHKPFPLVLIGMYVLSIWIHYIFKIKTKTLTYLNL